MMVELSVMAKASVVLAAALALTRLMGRRPASARALILTSAFGVVLALPLVALVLPSRPIAVPFPPMTREAETFSATGTSVPVASPQVRDTRTKGTAPHAFEPPAIATVLRAVWAFGVLIVFARLGVGLLRLRALRNAGQRWDDPVAYAIVSQATSRNVRLLLHRSLRAPMTCGIVQPVIGLPVDAQGWAADELRRALIHEVEHVRRADWLVQMLARLACGIYWFNPLVWVVAQRLHLECEYACDDAVVRDGARAPYAQQLVSMARQLFEQAARPVLSMADRRDLAKRVDAVLNQHRSRGQVRRRGVCLAAFAGVLITLALAPWRPVGAQSRGPVEDVLPIPTTLTGQAFSEVSIRRGDGTGSTAGSFDPRTRTFTARNASVLWLISQGYASVPQLEFTTGEPYEVHDTRITGGPEWIHEETFDIEARAGAPVSAESLRSMLRQLLRDSFGLVIRVDTTEVPAYRLVRVGNAGLPAPGLQPGNQSCAERWNSEGGGPGHVVRRCVTIPALAADVALAEVLGRPVIDRTGISGVFDVSLVHAPTAVELSTIYELSASDLPREVLARPTIFAAMEQQLGLRLEPTRGVVHTLAIASAVRPADVR